MLVRLNLTVAAFLASATAQTVDFTRDVKPVFEKKCAGCHGAALQMNGLRLDNSEDGLRGGYSGAVIVKGNSSSSKLIERISS
jgi:mono/diheme cytochrome c family protein